MTRLKAYLNFGLNKKLFFVSIPAFKIIVILILFSKTNYIEQTRFT